MDHGQLNIPGCTGGINADLDRYKAAQLKAQRIAAKASTAEMKRLRIEAKAMVNTLPAERLQSLASQMNVTVLQVKTKLLKTAHWNPAALIKAEQRAAAVMTEGAN